MDKFKKKIIFEEEMGPVQGESEQDKYEREWFGDASRALTQLVNSEKNAIIEYENVLKYQDYLDEEQVAQIQEILQDEKDHIVLLSKMISQVIPEDYPGSGDEVIIEESLTNKSMEGIYKYILDLATLENDVASHIKYNNGESFAHFWWNDEGYYTLVLHLDADASTPDDTKFWGDEELIEYNDIKLTADQLYNQLKKLNGDLKNFYGLRNLIDKNKNKYITEELYDTGISLSKKEDMEENEPNKYCQKYDLGQRVRFKHAGGALSKEVGMIIGIDSEGYYIIRWPDGENSNGISDVQLVPYIRRELGR